MFFGEKYYVKKNRLQTDVYKIIKIIKSFDIFSTLKQNLALPLTSSKFKLLKLE